MRKVLRRACLGVIISLGGAAVGITWFEDGFEKAILVVLLIFCVIFAMRMTVMAEHIKRLERPIKS